MPYDWRFENSIINGKKLDIDDEYDQWRINLVLINHKDIVLHINEVNKYYIPNKNHYNYLFNSVKKYKRWFKGPTKEEKKRFEQEKELIGVISEYYKYNTLRAKEALRLLTEEQIETIRKQLDKGGIK